jgi:hypothetical protein
MAIEIFDNITITDIQKSFESNFPYLKLMFFKKPHHEHEGNLKKDLITSNAKIVSLKEGINRITFDENFTVIELEDLFRDHFGLNAQVFRKSGKSWIETTVTDNWTLKKQNEQGKEISELGF